MREKINFKIILDDLEKMTIGFFPYLFIFYLISVVLALFFSFWRLIIYWPAFHGLIIVYSIFYIFKAIKTKENVFNPLILALIKIYRWLKSFCFWLLKKISKLKRLDWIKISIIVVILILAIWRGIGLLDLGVLSFGLLSSFFIFDSRISAGSALLLLALCPVLILLKKSGLAEGTAIYAYYFLVITVVTQIREFKKCDNN
jgi:hypothetical protein